MDDTTASALAVALADDLDAAFPAFVNRFGRDVYSLALRLTGRPDAEDVAQDAFVRAYTALRGYEPKRVADLELRPWVITIALNVVRNRLRTNARHPTTPLADRHPASDHHSDRNSDQRMALATALATLPLPARQAVVLRHVLGCSTDETAAILDRPTGTVKAQVARSLAALRTQLEDFR